MKLNRTEKEFILDDGSPISILPADDNIFKITKIEKMKHRYQDVNKNQVKFGAQKPADIEYENNKTESANFDLRKK